MKKVLIILKTIFAKNKLLILILIIAALLRFVGTKPGYNQFHADEGISYSAAVSMIKNGNLDPLRYDYPSLVPLINFVFFKFLFIPLNWINYYVSHIVEIIDGTVHIPISPLEKKKIFQLFVLGERNINALFWGRYVTALFSFGDVVLTYLLAKKLFNKNIGLISALLLTFNYKHVINSHIGLPDVYNGFFVLLVLLYSVSLWKNPSRKNYLLAGIAVGLSFSVKYQMFAVFPFLLAHFYASIEKRKINLRKLLNTNIFLSFAVAGLAIFLVNPYHIAFLDRTLEIVKGVSLKYAMGVKKINLYPLSYFYHIDYGPIEFFAVFLGLAISLKKYFKKTLLFLSFLTPFSFIFFYYSNGGFYVRNFITISPIIFITAAVGITTIYEILTKRMPVIVLNTALIIFLFAMVFIPAKNSILSSYAYTKPWGFDLMRPWVQKNLPNDAVVAAHPFDAVNLGIKNERTEFEISGAYSITEHKENGAQYAVLDLNWAGSPFYYWMSFGFDKLKDYWNKPLDEMRNTFHGIAAEEYFRYQLHSVTKPWQAPDTHIIVAKLPKWEEVDMVNIARFEFSKGLDGWLVFGNNKKIIEEPKYIFDSNLGKNQQGSVEYLPAGSDSPNIRISSLPISIKEGHLYKIEGYLKTDLNLASRERDGFLRVDFYSDNLTIEKVGVTSSVSSRVYGTQDWVKKEIIDRAPEGSKFMIVSFQTYITTRTKIWLDDVNVFESKEVIEDITKKEPYNIKQVDFNYLYPNSHGNL